MDELRILILAVVQGITEFLPISSSAHLILMPHIFGWRDQGLAFDVAVHFGSMIAVLYHFRDEVFCMLKSWVRSIRSGVKDQYSVLAWWIILGTLPGVVIGFFAQSWIEGELRDPMVIAVASITFGLLLWFADVRGARQRDELQLRLVDVLLIGFAQALALIPGISRASVTITMGLLLGLTRQAAARFSFLLAIPLIFASGALQSVRLLNEATPVDWWHLGLGALFSAVSAGLCIHFFLRLVERVGMFPFVVYRVLLGIIILGLLH